MVARGNQKLGAALMSTCKSLFPVALLVGTVGMNIVSATAQSPNAQMIADRVLQNEAALKAACKQGPAGVTPLVQQAVGALMREGKALNPQVDGPAAGQVLAARCQSM